MSDVIQKVSSMSVPDRLFALADASEKVAVERDDLKTKLSTAESDLRIELLLSKLADQDQLPWSSREEGREMLKKIAAEGRLPAFEEASRTLLPGSLPKVARGLAETQGPSPVGGPRPQKTKEESMEAFADAIMGGGDE